MDRRRVGLGLIRVAAGFLLCAGVDFAFYSLIAKGTAYFIFCGIAGIIWGLNIDNLYRGHRIKGRWKRNG